MDKAETIRFEALKYQQALLGCSNLEMYRFFQLTPNLINGRIDDIVNEWQKVLGELDSRY